MRRFLSYALAPIAVLIALIISTPSLVVGVQCIECDNQQQSPQPIIIPMGSPSGHGAHRGAGSDFIKIAIENLIEDLLNRERGSLARSSYPLTDPPPPAPVDFPILALSTDLKNLICRGKMMTKRHGDFEDAIPFISSIISTHLDVPLGTVNAALTTDGFCDAFVEDRKHSGYVAEVQPVTFTIAEVVLTVDRDGVPISSVPAWNACIRNTVYQDSTGNPFTCRNSHSGSKWYHPDLPGFTFTWNMRRKSISDVPDNTRIVTVRDVDPSNPAHLTTLDNTISWSFEVFDKENKPKTLEERMAVLYQQCAQQVFSGRNRHELAVCLTYDRLQSQGVTL